MSKMMRELRDMLSDELDCIAERGSLNDERLKRVDLLTHSIKSIDTILAMENSGYSREYPKYSYDYDEYKNDRNGSRNRGTMRNYSRDDMKDSIVHRLSEMMHEAESDKDREVIRRCMEQLGG